MCEASPGMPYCLELNRMKIAYLINAHCKFKQLERLIGKLNNPNAVVFLHIDKKVDDSSFTSLKVLLNKYNVKYIKKRVDVIWAGFTQVEATINGLEEISSSSMDFDYINFISGQDYPIKHNEFIQQFLCRNKGFEFIECYEISTCSHAEAMVRFQRYCLVEKIKNGFVRLNTERALRVLLPKRKVPLGYRTYGGSSWWTISADCASYILDFVNKEIKATNFFKLALCPDETFFQTIIMNSEFNKKVYSNNLRYINWEKGKVNPRVLTRRDYDDIKCSDKLFARKFDSDLDEEILDKIDSDTTSNIEIIHN